MATNRSLGTDSKGTYGTTTKSMTVKRSGKRKLEEGARIFALVGGAGQRVAIWSRIEEKKKFYVVEGMVKDFEKLEPDIVTAIQISKVLTKATSKRSEQVVTKARIEQLVIVSDNLDATRKWTMVRKDNWEEIVEDFEKGMMVEEIIPDAVKMIESNEGIEEVIYIEGKV